MKGRAVYVNEAWRDSHLETVTHPLSSPSGPIFFSEEDLYVVQFSHNDALVVIAHIRCCKVSKNLVDGGSNVNIFYGHALDQMDDTLELTQKLIIPKTQSLLYGFDGNEVHSPSMAEFSVYADPFNIITEFNILDVLSPYNAFLRRS